MKPTKTTPTPQKILSAPTQDFLSLHRWKIVAGIAILAFVIRIWRLDFLSLWVDEYVHAIPAKQFRETGRFSVTDNNGILLTWINCLMAKLFGASAFVLRLPLVISGSLLVPVAYVFGKKLFGSAAGLVTAFLVCFSPFLIFWSRIDRMYEFVCLFYMLTLLCFWLIVEDTVTFIGSARKNITIQKKWLWAGLVASFMLAFLSQLQSVLFLLTIGFYGSLVTLHRFFSKQKDYTNNKLYRWLAIANLIGLLLFFTPLTNVVNKPIVSMLNGSEGLANARIPGWISGMLVPDWDAFSAFLSSDDWLKYFKTYYNVTRLDYPLLGLAGWAGFMLAFFYSRRSAYYLLCAFVAPLLIMGFFLREPNQPRYLCFIYPVFLCAMAVSIVTLCFNWLPRITGRNIPSRRRNIFTAVALVLLLFVVPFRSVFALILSNKHGHQLQRELTEAAFVNWKEPGNFVKDRLQKNDLVFATVSGTADFYINAPTIPFRQFYYSLEQKKYLSNAARPFVAGANSYEEFVQTVKTHPRGWLLLDHYLFSQYVDPRLVNYIHEHCKYYPEASSDGSVQVFGWDSDTTSSNNRSPYLIELGKPFSLEQAAHPFGEEDLNQYSNLLNFTACSNCNSIEIHFFTRNINYTGEASIVINDKKTFIIPPPGNTASGESMLSFNLQQWGIRPGQTNTARFMYTPPVDAGMDSAKGFLVRSFYFVAK